MTYLLIMVLMFAIYHTFYALIYPSAWHFSGNLNSFYLNFLYLTDDYYIFW